MSDLTRREAEFLLYQAEDGRTRVEVRFDGATAWLSLGQMAELFQRDKSVISRHIKNVFAEGELRPESVVAEYATTASDGKTYQGETVPRHETRPRGSGRGRAGQGKG